MEEKGFSMWWREAQKYIAHMHPYSGPGMSGMVGIMTTSV